MSYDEEVYCRGRLYANADDAYDDFRQQEIDDMSARNAAGISPEELSMQDAHAAGARTGSQGLSFSLNPYQDGTPEHDAWNRGWHAASSQRAARMVA